MAEIIRLGDAPAPSTVEVACFRSYTGAWCAPASRGSPAILPFGSVKRQMRTGTALPQPGVG